MQWRGNGVLNVVIFPVVGIGQEADVALEGGFAEQGTSAVTFGRVVVYGTAHDRRVMSFDDGAYTGGAGVRGNATVEERRKIGVCENGEGHEEFGFVGNVREDERRYAFPIVS